MWDRHPPCFTSRSSLFFLSKSLCLWISYHLTIPPNTSLCCNQPPDFNSWLTVTLFNPTTVLILRHFKIHVDDSSNIVTSKFPHFLSSLPVNLYQWLVPLLYLSPHHYQKCNPSITEISSIQPSTYFSSSLSQNPVSKDLWPYQNQRFVDSISFSLSFTSSQVLIAPCIQLKIHIQSL